MPRNGSGVYTEPPGTLAISGETIESDKYNSFVRDLVEDANGARPVTAGGTGATNAADARANLGLNLYDADVALTEEQKGQFRVNVGADLMAGFRNKVIDGRFRFCSVPLPVAVAAGTSAYTFDLWQVRLTPGISCSAQQVAAVPGFTGGRQYAEFTFSGTGIAGSNVVHPIENVDTISGQVTVSAFIADSVPQNYSVFIRQHFGTGGSPSTSVDTAIGTMAAPATFGTTPLKVTATLPATTGKTFGTNGDHRLELIFLCAGANAHTLYIGDVAIVQGDARDEVNPSSPRPIAEEADLVGRYIESSNGLGSAQISCNVTSGSTYRNVVTYRIPKRVSASVTVANVTATNFPNTITSSPSAYGFSFTSVASGTGAGQLTYDWITDARF